MVAKTDCHLSAGLQRVDKKCTMNKRHKKSSESLSTLLTTLTSMALGEIVAEARGKVISLRVLPDGKVEVSLQGSGRLLGSEITDITTFSSAMRPNGTAYGEGQTILMLSDGGGSAEFKGTGVGKPTGRGGWRYSYGGAFQTITSQKLGRLLDVYIVGEYNADENGNYQWKDWEWKY
jgi:hypothetical protein